MDRKWFEEEMNSIDVPKEEVFEAISTGIQEGRKQKVRKKTAKISAAFTTAAASMVLVSGFLFSPVNNALAKLPVLGGIYEKVGSDVGKELYFRDKVTEVNQAATSSGVDVTITSTYYDGNVIGVTFKAKGDDLSIEHMDEGNRPVSGYSYHLFDGKDQNQWGSGSSGLKKDGDEFIGSIEFYRDGKEPPENFTLPLTFTHMADVNGTWTFDVPVKRIPSEKIQTNVRTESADGEFELQVKSVTKGKATTTLEYTYSVESRKDTLNLIVFDDLGNRLSKSSAETLNIKEIDGDYQKTVRELFTSKLSDKAQSLKVRADMERVDEDGIISLNDLPSFQVKSPRFGYQVTVQDIQNEKGKVTVDFTIDNIKEKQFKYDILENFAQFVQVIPSKDIKRNAKDELDYNEMLNHMVRSNKTKTVDKDTLRYQSTFTLPQDANLEDYSLIVPFATLSSNDKPIEMKPFEINLK
ncbi:DUF4179 domain-containing protein [Rossellomorea aquimaris]|uniref:Uncharacterized protein DUF4179 n=1 Tax=Rossellomorea aquimaris TaxID=189382 RepID=A0A366ENE1_9BACI|nr:DUF4179 domain-containing protein [Rossellomorea aquimaris]RBP03009.1 uncharacterized protein DUF4179 [Rossellomorea aquimaris]